MTTSGPPGLAVWLLRHLASGPRLESILGDLQEQLSGGRSVAWYWRQTITTILVGPMKQRLLWVLIPTVAAAVITATLSHFFLPTRYQAEAKLQLMPARIPETYVPPTRTVPIQDRMENIKARILSRAQLERIIADLNLYPAERKAVRMQEVVELLRSDIQLKVINGDTLRVVVTSDDARMAASLSDHLASLFINESLSDRTALDEGVVTFLDTEIEDFRRQIIAKEHELQKLRTATSGELSQGDLLPYEVLKDHYKALLGKQLDAEVYANLERLQQGEQFNLLEPAHVPTAPLGPRKAVVNLGGALVGLTFGLVMVVISMRRPRAEPAQV
jgi:uncharacterized protein involved in exopolysaccharide biosynthesis